MQLTFYRRGRLLSRRGGRARTFQNWLCYIFKCRNERNTHSQLCFLVCLNELNVNNLKFCRLLEDVYYILSYKTYTNYNHNSFKRIQKY